MTGWDQGMRIGMGALQVLGAGMGALGEMGEMGVGVESESLGMGGAGGPCFPAGTPVRMADGSKKPIEQVKKGDRVLSADPATGKQSAQQVVRTFVHPSDTLLTIRTEDGRSVEATPNHPFWVEGKGFVAAKRLARSDLLVDVDGNESAVASVTVRHGDFTVYNFEVENTHTYYAGEAGWWVHNNCTDIAIDNWLGGGGAAGDGEIWRLGWDMGDGFNFHDIYRVGDMVTDELITNGSQMSIGDYMDAFTEKYGPWNDDSFFRWDHDTDFMREQLYQYFGRQGINPLDAVDMVDHIAPH